GIGNVFGVANAAHKNRRRFVVRWSLVGWKVLENLCRPSGTRSGIRLHPGLTSLCENASYAPLGLSHFPLAPRVSALGCILPPLRGWELRFTCHLWFGV